MLAVQKCAKQVLGQIPVEWGTTYDNKEIAAAMREVWTHDLVYTWCHDNGYDQWWIDALTIDPSQLVEDEEGIGMPGMEKLVIENDLVNASVGSVPIMQVPASNHAIVQAHGILIFGSCCCVLLS